MLNYTKQYLVNNSKKLFLFVDKASNVSRMATAVSMLLTLSHGHLEISEHQNLKRKLLFHTLDLKNGRSSEWMEMSQNGKSTQSGQSKKSERS